MAHWTASPWPSPASSTGTGSYLYIDDHEYMRTYFGFNIEYKVPRVFLHNQAGFGIRIHIRSASAFEMRIRIHVLHSA